MSIEVKIESIVKNLGSNVKFLQPLYEAIVNSLEANARHIKVIFHKSKTLDDTQFCGKLEGFDIIDDGDGFNENNRNAFSELWTTNKIKLGCKGSGRFTWLNVFSNIYIDSYIKAENVHVSIPFDLKYEKANIVIKQENVHENKTTISFKNITEKYKFISGKKECQCDANLAYIKKSILDYLLVKLFLMSKNHREFELRLVLDESIEIINNETIPELNSKNFKITSDITDESFNFTLYYLFKNDGKNSKKMYFCSNNRSTKEIDDDSLGFSASLPDKTSFIMLLTSKYFDDKDDDGRGDLIRLTNLKQPTLDCPLLLSKITKEAKKEMKLIINENVPNLLEYNAFETNKAIEKAPYLTDYIKMDDDIVKSESELIIKANKAFNEEKIKKKKKFESLLQSKSIDETAFSNSINEISQIATEELGEYILYRQSIIDGLYKSIDDDEKKEKYIHNIFFPMNTKVLENKDRHFLSNLWLLDDKFMGYVKAYSDISVGKISKDFERLNICKKRPDMVMFYNTIEDKSKNVVMVELKGANASSDEKSKAITELPNDIASLRKELCEKVNAVWGYIITLVDNSLSESLVNQDYKQLFASDGENKMFYQYYKNVNAHIYVIDLKTICSDAYARNKTFLDILKQK